MRTLLLLLLLTCAAGAQNVLSNVKPWLGGAQRIDPCHIPNCTTNSEVVYDSRTGTTVCATGGSPTQIWSNNYLGTNPINLSLTTVGLSAITQSVGNPKLSWDGNWIILQVLKATSNYACNDVTANPGAGFDNDGYICDWPAVASCTDVIAVTANIGAGTLHPLFTSDTGKVCYFHISGAGGFNAANEWGDLRCAAFTHPGGTPTLSSTVTRSPTTAACTVHCGYEPAGAHPFNPDLIYFTIFTPNWNAFQVLSYSISTGATVAMTQLNMYSEFWQSDSTGSYAVTGTTQWTLNPNPVNYSGVGVPPSDVAIEILNSGTGSIPVTSFNTPSSPFYTGVSSTIGKPAWGNGRKYIYFTLQRGGINTIYMGTFVESSTLSSGYLQLLGFGKLI